MSDRQPPSRHSLRTIVSRDFALGFLAFFTFLVVFFGLVPILPVYLASLGSDAREIGVLVGVYSVSSLVFRPLAGRVLQRYPEKSVMIFAALLFAITFPACILFRPFWPLFAVRLVQGVTYACFDTAVFAWVVKVTPLAQRGGALGYFMLAPGLATVIAPSFGMFLVNRFSFTVFFLFCTASCLSALFFSLTLKGDRIPNRAVGPTRLTSFFEGSVIVPGIVGFFHNFVLGSLMAFFPLYAIQCGVANPGYFFSAAALMTVAGRALAGRILEAWSKEEIIVTFVLTSVAAVTMLSFSKSLPMFIFIGLLWGAAVAFIFPVSMAYALDYARSSGGTAVGTFRALMDLGTAAGPMAMGLIIPVTGYPAMFRCLAAICLVNLCYFQFYVRRGATARSLAGP